MGEAVHLVHSPNKFPNNIYILIVKQNHHERTALITAARTALDEINLPAMPIVAGVGAPSTRESIELAREAAHAGADFVMLIPPGYYAGALLADLESVKRFFVDVAEASPVPV